MKWMTSDHTYPVPYLRSQWWLFGLCGWLLFHAWETLPFPPLAFTNRGQTVRAGEVMGNSHVSKGNSHVSTGVSWKWSLRENLRTKAPGYNKFRNCFIKWPSYRCGYIRVRHEAMASRPLLGRLLKLSCWEGKFKKVLRSPNHWGACKVVKFRYYGYFYFIMVAHCNGWMRCERERKRSIMGIMW